MKEPTMKEVLELVEFDRNSDGSLLVRNVYGNVWGYVRGDVCGDVYGNVVGDVCGDVWGDVGGYVRGKISGREWQYFETPKDRVIRLIREGKSEEAIKVLEGE